MCSHASIRCQKVSPWQDHRGGNVVWGDVQDAAQEHVHHEGRRLDGIRHQSGGVLVIMTSFKPFRPVFYIRTGPWISSENLLIKEESEFCTVSRIKYNFWTGRFWSGTRGQDERLTFRSNVMFLRHGGTLSMTEGARCAEGAIDRRFRSWSSSSSGRGSGNAMVNLW